MDDKDLKINVMYQMEVATDLLQSLADRLEMDGTDAYIIPTDSYNEVLERSAAALYMVQAMLGGFKPDNYQTVLARAANRDAWAQANDLIAGLQRGHTDGVI
jgi:hypothetical protein